MVFFIQNEIITPWDLSDPKIERLAYIVETPIANRLKLFSQEMIKISKFGSGPKWFDSLNQINRAFAMAQIEIGTLYIQYNSPYQKMDEKSINSFNDSQKQKYIELGKRLTAAIQQHCPDKTPQITIPQILMP